MDPILINAKYFLNADDKARLAEEIATEQATLEDLRTEKAANAKEYATRIDDAAKAVSFKAATYRNGYEYREQPATKSLDYDAGMVRYHHAETGVLLKEEVMDAHERQRHFELERQQAAEEGRAGHETTREKSVRRERFVPSDYGVDIEEDEA